MQTTVYLNLQVPVDYSGERVLCLLDAINAFNSKELEYLWVTLEQFGIKLQFILWAKLLYGE